MEIDKYLFEKFKNFKGEMTVSQQIINSVIAVSPLGNKTVMQVGKFGVEDIILDGQIYKGFNKFDEQVREVVLPNFSMHWVGVREVTE